MIFRESRQVLIRNPIFLCFIQGGVRTPCPPSESAHINQRKLKHSCMKHQDYVGHLVEVMIITASVNWKREREREREREIDSSKPAHEILHLPHILSHYLYMHVQPSLVGLEPSRAAKFCSASSSLTLFLSYLCVRVQRLSRLCADRC